MPEVPHPQGTTVYEATRRWPTGIAFEGTVAQHRALREALIEAEANLADERDISRELGREVLAMQAEIQRLGVRLGEELAHVERLDHEYHEAKLEIVRHHRDFERIRAVLDGHDMEVPSDDGWAVAADRGNLLFRIRNIVG